MTRTATAILDDPWGERAYYAALARRPKPQAVFRNTVAVGKTHYIPNLEMALVSKFMAMLGPTRHPDKKLLDAADFTNIVLRNRSILDLQKLRRLVDKVNPGNGARILGIIEDINAGRSIQL